uniref:Uncharacterized protein n=1 Tax=Plectus sambesii TaxID=2011161 RepID=A0A914VHE3_9BILA
MRPPAKRKMSGGGRRSPSSDSEHEKSRSSNAESEEPTLSTSGLSPSVVQSPSQPPVVRRGRGRPRKSLPVEMAPLPSPSPAISSRSPSPPTSATSNQLKKMFTFSAAISERTATQSGTCGIFGCAFSPYATEQDPIFSTVSNNRVNVYECPPAGTTPAIRLLRSFKDPSVDESFYACAWLYCTETKTHLLAAAGNRGLIRVLSPHSGDCVRTLFGHGEPVNELRVHPRDSVILASGGKDFTVRLWNVGRDECLAMLGGVEGHLDQILSLDFDSTGSYIVSASMDHTVKLWETGPGTVVADAISASHNAEPITTCPEVHYPLASSRDLHLNYVDCVRIYDKFIFSKSCENALVLWKFGELDDGLAGRGNALKVETAVTRLVKMDLPDADVWFIKFAIDPLDRFIVSGNQAGELHIWPLDKGLPPVNSAAVLTHKELRCSIRQVAISYCGTVIIAVTDDATIYRWNRNVVREENDSD